jgi:hypothetical protein
MQGGGGGGGGGKGIIVSNLDFLLIFCGLFFLFCRPSFALSFALSHHLSSPHLFPPPSYSSVPQLIVDTNAGAHQMVVHYGDIAYNLDDQCGAVGDLFANAVSPFASQVPVVFGVGNHETAKNFTYVDYLQRFKGQADMAAAAGSPSIRYLSFNVGLMHIAMVDTDAYIYSPVYPVAPPQYAWLEEDLKRVDRTVTPWLVLIGHRCAQREMEKGKGKGNGKGAGE